MVVGGTMGVGGTVGRRHLKNETPRLLFGTQAESAH